MTSVYLHVQINYKDFEITPAIQNTSQMHLLTYFVYKENGVSVWCTIKSIFE